MTTINGSPQGEDIDEKRDGGSISGDDTINAMAGDDTIKLYKNARTVEFIGAVDTTDTVHGGSGTDRLRFATDVAGTLSFSGDPASGYTGTWVAGHWHIAFDGIEQFDLTATGSYAPTFNTGGGNDIITDQTSGLFTANSGAGNDTIIISVLAADGNGNLDFGAGTDRLVIQETTADGPFKLLGLTGSLSAGYGGSVKTRTSSTVTFASVEAFTITTAQSIGSGGSDYFLNDEIHTGDGDDVIQSNAGDDKVFLGKGKDIADGGTGANLLSLDLSDESQGVTLDLLSGGEQMSRGTGSIRNFGYFIGPVVGTGFGDVFRGNLTGGANIDTGAGDDLVEVVDGSQRLDLSLTNLVDTGAGVDSIIYRVSAGVLDYQGGISKHDGITTRLLAESITIIAAATKSVIRTTSAESNVTTFAGADTIILGLGNQIADAGGGDKDQLGIDLADEQEGVTIDLTLLGEQQAGGTGSIRNFESFTDHVFGTAFDDVFRSRSPNFNPNYTTFGTGSSNDLVDIFFQVGAVDMGTGTDRLVLDASNIFPTAGIQMSLFSTDDTSGFITSAFGPFSFSGVDIFDLTGTIFNDQLVGGSGNDVIDAASGSDQIDGGAGFDTAVFSGSRDDYTIARLTDGTVQVEGPDGSDRLAHVEQLRFADGSMFDLSSVYDFDGNGSSDILWRNVNGLLTDWLSGETGYAPSGALSISVSADWKIAGTGDFDGDWLTDLVWRNDNGDLTTWRSNGATFDATSFNLTVSTDWAIAGTGDFDGDGKDDLLWRNANGQLTQWLSDGTGFNGAGQPLLGVGTDWKVAGIGDFDGDGKDDILWRNDDGTVTQWLGSGTGFNGAGQPQLLVSPDWKVAGVGDFNADGKDDILWRNDNGTVTQWLGDGAGFNGAGQAQLGVGTDWKVAKVVNADGDDRDDILWRNDNGDVTVWLGSAAGFNGAGQPVYHVGNDWMAVG